MILRFAILGCGRIASKHIDAIKQNNSQATLVAVCDIVSSKAQKLSEAEQIPFYTDYNDMFTKHPEIDVVCILTESGNHAKHVIDIVSKYKKHIVVEKPMALQLGDADDMIRVCDEQGVKLFVVKQNRFNLPVIELRKAVEEGKFGKLVMGTVRVRWSRKQEYYDADAWRGTWALDGGVFTNQASHHIDLLEWMLGEPVSVFAKSRTALADIETEDTGVAVITFANGAIGIVEATTAVRPKDLEGSLSILGEKGSVVIGGFAVNDLQTWNFVDETDTKESKETPPNVYGFGHARYIANVCENLQHNQRALVDGLEGRKSLELINAIYESIETGKEVLLKFNPIHSKLGQK